MVIVCCYIIGQCCLLVFSSDVCVCDGCRFEYMHSVFCLVTLLGNVDAVAEQRAGC